MQKSNLITLALLTLMLLVLAACGGRDDRTKELGSKWKQISNVSADSLYSVSCPTPSVCYATDDHGRTLKSIDAGLTWTPAAPAGAAGNLTCASEQLCLFASIEGNSGIKSSRDGGTSWTSVENFPLERSLVDNGEASAKSIRCVNEATCFALAHYWRIDLSGNLSGLGIFQTLDAGHTWHAVVRLGDNDNALQAFACPSAARCIRVVPDGEGTEISRGPLNGDKWSVVALSPEIIATLAQARAIDCPDATTCYVVGNPGPQSRAKALHTALILKTTDAGATWTLLESGKTNGLNAISCADAANCVAVYGNCSGSFTSGGCSSDLLMTSDGGKTWDNVEQKGVILNKVSCPGISLCVAVGKVAQGNDGVIFRYSVEKINP